MNTVKIQKGNVKMIAHRGLSGIERENSNAAFIAAGNRSYFGIETDLYHTADGHFVICHDSSTKRVSGDAIDIENSTYDSIRQIKLYDRDGISKRNDLCIPDIFEYVDTCKCYEKRCVLELKSDFSEAEIAQIVEILKEKEWLDMVIFISFHYPNLERVRAILPNQPCQWLTGYVPDDEMIARMQKDRFGLDIQYNPVTKELIDRIHAIGQEFNVWICNDPKAAEQLVEWGVDYITSDILE